MTPRVCIINHRHLVADPNRFPNGIKYLADYVSAQLCIALPSRHGTSRHIPRDETSSSITAVQYPRSTFTVHAIWTTDSPVPTEYALQIIPSICIQRTVVATLDQVSLPSTRAPTLQPRLLADQFACCCCCCCCCCCLQKVHAKGLKLGLYTALGNNSCAAGKFAVDQMGLGCDEQSMPRCSRAQLDIDDMVSWDIDHLKVSGRSKVGLVQRRQCVCVCVCVCDI